MSTLLQSANSRSPRPSLRGPGPSQLRPRAHRPGTQPAAAVPCRPVVAPRASWSLIVSLILGLIVATLREWRRRRVSAPRTRRPRRADAARHRPRSRRRRLRGAPVVLAVPARLARLIAVAANVDWRTRRDFELPTLGIEIRCSIQLSYECTRVFNGLAKCPQSLGTVQALKTAPKSIFDGSDYQTCAVGARRPCEGFEAETRGLRPTGPVAHGYGDPWAPAPIGGPAPACVRVLRDVCGTFLCSCHIDGGSL